MLASDSLPYPLRKAPYPPPHNHLYRNNRDGTFTDVTETAGVATDLFSIAAVAADAEKQTPQHRGKKSRLAAKKPDGAAEPNAEAKDARKEAKSGKHANAKPDTARKAEEKLVAAADKPAAKPAKPKTTARRSTKPAPKAGEAKPADQKTDATPHS